MGFISAMVTACCFAFVFQCTPVQSYWVLSLWGDRHCVNEGALATASSALSMVTDIIILALPLKYLLGTSRPIFGGRIVADPFHSIENLYEGENPSGSLNEFGGAVSINLFFWSTTAYTNKNMHCIWHEIQSYPQSVPKQRCNL